MKQLGELSGFQTLFGPDILFPISNYLETFNVNKLKWMSKNGVSRDPTKSLPPPNLDLLVLKGCLEPDLKATGPESL